MTALDPLATARSTDRPRAHTGTSDNERAVFAATERLIAEVPLQDLTVAQIISAAEISRATFYFYFSSKFAVLSGLLASVMDEIFDVVQPFVDREEGAPPIQALRESLAGAIQLWASHRPAMRAIHEHWNTTPELRALWIGVVERFTEAVGAELDRQRAAGLALDGLPSRQLAATLLWSTERCLYVAGLGVDEHLPVEQDTLEPLMAIWTGTFYGGAPGNRRAAAGPQPQDAATSASSSL